MHTNGALTYYLGHNKTHSVIDDYIIYWASNTVFVLQPTAPIFNPCIGTIVDI